ncbi:MAG: enoyl-CoA hydratase/isomerase family protein [Anaerolineales bacterium]|nr:enoyl-CoA hydratase/isomerase family protein [Anaerolineales bacterium]
MSERQFVKLSIEDRVAVITIDHAPVNALNDQVLDELDAVVGEVIASADAKAAVITGAGQLAFVAGADINVFDALLKEGAAAEGRARDFLQKGQNVFAKIENAPKPFIAAVNGVALGGGMELAMACHMRVIGDRAKLGQPEINLGIIPGWGGTQRLPRLVGKAKAIELILTGDQITAQEALRLNLVNKVVPGGEVLKTARDLAKKISQKGGLAIRAALDAIGTGASKPIAEGLLYEAERINEVVKTEDMREGVSAFLQKRQPVFKDQ